MFLLRNSIYFNRYFRNMTAVYRHSESVGPDGYRILRYPDLISTAWYHTTLTYHGWGHVCTYDCVQGRHFYELTVVWTPPSASLRYSVV
jgi:hypothetical protein